MINQKTQNQVAKAVKKLFLSTFVAGSFVAFVLENNSAASAGSQVAVAANFNSSLAASPAQANPSAANANATTSSDYKDGTYTGPVINVTLGYVQVQATIQNGQITNVQFLQYPNERRTSTRINSVAIPQLQQEAIQAQSANVNIITGATLTSEGFQQSLQVALSQAKG